MAKQWQIHLRAKQRRRAEERDREAHRAQREADRERHQLEELRLKALGEQAKGKPGVWTAEYKGRLAAIKAQQEAAERRRRDMAKGCGTVALILLGLGSVSIVILLIVSAATALLPGAPAPKPVPKTAPAKSRR